MISDWIDRDDLAIYVASGANKTFDKEARALLKSNSDEAELTRLDGELAEWVIARVQGHKRSARGNTPATKALWRAFRAIAATQYHLREDPARTSELREIRNRIERLWSETSPTPPS